MYICVLLVLVITAAAFWHISNVVRHFKATCVEPQIDGNRLSVNYRSVCHITIRNICVSVHITRQKPLILVTRIEAGICYNQLHVTPYVYR